MNAALIRRLLGGVLADRRYGDELIDAVNVSRTPTPPSRCVARAVWVMAPWRSQSPVSRVEWPPMWDE